MDEPVTPIHKEKKFIVFMTCLTRLLTWCHCPDCGSVDISTCHNVIGSLLVITLLCASCYKKVTWNNMGNILLCHCRKGSAGYENHGIGDHIFTDIVPAPEKCFVAIWNMRQTFLLATFQAEGRDLVLGGDGRADSPGHCAKFGSYTMLELHANLVIDIQLVQVGYRYLKKFMSRVEIT
ncbi:hypothetical protein F7725_022256 [Dissostichus mawsoni]|uniref:Uncharacterized protein n=1 Tax=Dissostichus mawsoni TaxID=36200 RepID=A0A7J5YZH2_DISMA|nr:hypothetical protein F7725_022256 [Dissostichus mawsoni]